MSGLIVSDAVQIGIKGTTKTKKKNTSKKYLKLVEEANEKIISDNDRYRRALDSSRLYFYNL